MGIYTFNPDTLTYRKLPFGTTIIKGAAFVAAAFIFLSINVVDATEYERIIQMRGMGNQFSEERLRSKLKELNVRFADVAVAQLARGSQHGHAYYDSWEDSVLDYAMWCATYAKHCRTNEQFLSLLNGYYAEDPNYVAKLRKIMSRQ